MRIFKSCYWTETWSFVLMPESENLTDSMKSSIIKTLTMESITSTLTTKARTKTKRKRKDRKKMPSKRR